MVRSFIKDMIWNYIFGNIFCLPFLWFFYKSVAIRMDDFISILCIVLFLCFAAVCVFFNACRYSDFKEGKYDCSKSAFIATIFFPIILGFIMGTIVLPHFLSFGRVMVD